MKKHLLALSCFALLSGAYAYAIDGEGTETDPYQITSYDDLKDVAAMEEGAYFILMNDIDLAGINYVSAFPKADAPGYIHFDGNNHVIKNLTSRDGYASLFGNVTGSIKNLGLEDVDLYAGDWGPAGAIGGYCGLNDIECTIDNCYSTGTVKGYFAGGLVGGVEKNNKVIITNSYSLADCTSGNFIAGGILASVCWGATAEISNCYAAGDITSAGMAGGIIGGTSNYEDENNKHGDAVETAILNNVIAWNETVKGSLTGALVSSGATYDIQTEETDCYVFAGMKINDVAVEEGKTDKELEAIATAWSAYASETVDGYPVLKWQVGESSAIADVISTSDDSAQYFNLQGVKVAEPAAGLYIVRRGNTVSKQLVR